MKIASLILIFSGVVQMVPFANAAEEAGRVAISNGDVQIGKGDQGAGHPVKPNDPIYNDDMIKTGKDASAKLLFSDQSVMDLGPESALKVSDYALKSGENRTGTFSLMYGRLRALVTKKVGDAGKVEVKSGASVMGVRGTEFMVEKPRGGPANLPPACVVASGSLRVNTGGGVYNVGAGQMLTGAQIVQLSPSQIQSMLSTAKAEDHTFSNAVTIKSGKGDKGGDSSGDKMMKLFGDNSAGSISTVASEKPALIAPPPPPPLLPNVNIVPGNRVHLTINVQ